MINEKRNAEGNTNRRGEQGGWQGGKKIKRQPGSTNGKRLEESRDALVSRPGPRRRDEAKKSMGGFEKAFKAGMVDGGGGSEQGDHIMVAEMKGATDSLAGTLSEVERIVGPTIWSPKKMCGRC
jgi:hypothetical protein